MKVTPATVVTAWGLLNVVLILVLLGFGDAAVAEIVYPSAALIIFTFALVVLLSGHGRASPERVIRLPGGLRYVVWLAVAAFLCGLGIIFAGWIVAVGVVVAVAALIGLIHSPKPPADPDADRLATLPLQRPSATSTSGESEPAPPGADPVRHSEQEPS